MKNLIYYPNFEVKDITFLKFALLYLDDLKPIIPSGIYNLEQHISKPFLSIMNSIDFIHPYSPNYEEAEYASRLACIQFEQYLRHPRMFLKQNSQSIFKNPNSHTTIIFHGKFSNAFYDYCIENKLGSECDEGIRVPNGLAFVYMSFLAEIISANNDFEMITDESKYCDLLISNYRRCDPSFNKNFEVAKNNIELNIPMNISNIPLENFIKLRAQKGFNQLRKAYAEEINKLIRIREEKKPDYSISSLLSYQKDFIKFCEYSMSMAASLTVTAANIKPLFQGSESNPLTAACAALLNLNTFYDISINIPGFINDLRNKHLARKYVAKIKKI